jgi:hypothetical protein
LYSIIGRSRRPGTAGRPGLGEGRHRTLRDVVRQRVGVDLAQQPAVGVERQQRLRLCVIHLEAVTDGAFVVVLPLHQAAAAPVADVLLARRRELDVVRPLADRAGPPPGDALHGQLVVDREEQGRRDREALLDGVRLELLPLDHRPRKPVEDEAFRRLLQRRHHHVHDDVVRDQLAGVHVLLRLGAQLGVLLDVAAEDVAGRDQGNRIPGGEPVRLCPLPRSRGSQKNDPHWPRNPS